MSDKLYTIEEFLTMTNEKTLVYFFEKNDLLDIYTFDTAVPVEIYDRKLSINISELLKGNI